MKKRYLASVCAVGLLMGSQSALAFVSCGDEEAFTYLKCGDNNYKFCSSEEYFGLAKINGTSVLAAVFAFAQFTTPAALVTALQDGEQAAKAGKKLHVKGPACKALESKIMMHIGLGAVEARLTDVIPQSFSVTLSAGDMTTHIKPPTTAEGDNSDN